MADTAEYRYIVITKGERSSDRRPVFEQTGWSIVKDPGQPEHYEPMDSSVTGDATRSDFKEYNGFIVVDTANVIDGAGVHGGLLGEPRR